jgi:Rrf2 family protein
MTLSRESEYGLEGLTVLAELPRGRVLLLSDIAAARALPVGFLARIFQKLRRHNLVTSHRGAVRGYSLARPADQITLREVFEAIEGPDVATRCVFHSRACSVGQPCRLHDRWLPVATTLQGILASTTLAAVTGGRGAAPERSPTAVARARPRQSRAPAGSPGTRGAAPPAPSESPGHPRALNGSHP